MLRNKMIDKKFGAEPHFNWRSALFCVSRMDLLPGWSINSNQWAVMGKKIKRAAENC